MMFQLPLFGISSLSTSSAAASRAKTSQRPAEARALRAAGRVYGERCSGLSDRSDPTGFWLRTYLLSACEELTGYSLRWRESVTPAGHWWLVLGRSGHPINGTACGSWGDWLTPRASQTCEPAEQFSTRMGDRTLGCFGSLPAQVNGWRSPGKHTNGQPDQLTLPEQAKAAENWPTPRNEDSEQTGPHRGEPDTLTSAARSWPTPCKEDQKQRLSPADFLRNSPNLQTIAAGLPAQASLSTIGKPHGSLNAEWVASLMGFPPEYTAELISLLCEYWATPGAYKTRS